MYGLPQACSLGHDLLEKRLNHAGYHQSAIYTSLDDANHLIDTLKKQYDVSVDHTGHEYVKINLDWDYNKREVHLSMAPFREKA
eukprot:CCRYP_006015-RA/>CCRYP_006015-RA protein AED:0.47 eAED:0.47 QI:0/0/0/1/0/0/2/0/83